MDISGEAHILNKLLTKHLASYGTKIPPSWYVVKYRNDESRHDVVAIKDNTGLTIGKEIIPDESRLTELPWNLDVQAVSGILHEWFKSSIVAHIRNRDYVQVAFGLNVTAWDDYGFSDPTPDVRFLKSSFERTYDYEPDTLVLSKQDFQCLLDHPDIVDRLKYVPDFADAYKVAQVIGRLFGLDLEFHKSGHNAPYVYCKGYTRDRATRRNVCEYCGQGIARCGCGRYEKQ